VASRSGRRDLNRHQIHRGWRLRCMRSQMSAMLGSGTATAYRGADERSSWHLSRTRYRVGAHGDRPAPCRRSEKGSAVRAGSRRRPTRAG